MSIVIRAMIAVLMAVLAGAGQASPQVSGRSVTFVAGGDPSDPPRIVADFNGWDGGEMTPSGDGHTYSLRVDIDPAARIEYLVAYRNRFSIDPGNPLTVPSPAGPLRSELRMPGYRPSAELPAAGRTGTIDDASFESRKGERRRIRVYVPAVGAANLPILYVHDGDIVADRLELPAMLDSLIDRGEMAPAVVAFIDAIDRHDDYEPGSPFRSVLTDEIAPLLERRYQIAADRRAVMGLSRSTVGALDACVNGGLHFDACALLAPAVPPRDFPALLPKSGSALRVHIETGAYDIPLVADARALRDELTRRGVPVAYTESPQGHNHTAFRSRLPALMRALFPPPGAR